MILPTADNRASLNVRLDAAMLVGGAILLALVLLSTVALAGDMGDSLTRNTVRLSLAWYTVALCLMMQLRPEDWPAATLPGRIARWCWTWAVVVFLVHLVMAFQYFHHWSHAEAFARTEQISGVGAGLYVSYLFTLLWTADLAFWWLWPARYAARSRWIDRPLHAFMLFIVFNGMVVYEQGFIRLAGVMMFLVLASVWLTSKRAGREFAA